MIKNNIILPFLENYNNFKLRDNKFYNGEYYKVKRVISNNKNVSYAGNVVEIDHSDNLIVKWNRYVKDKDNMLYEIRYQNVMYILGYAPCIREAYTSKKYTFIIMDNLYKMGYETIGKLLYKKSELSPEILSEFSELTELYKNNNINFRDKILKDVALSINNMHIENIVHGDIHEYNIFYNLKTSDVKFIDFSYTSFVNGYKNAMKKERYVGFRDGFKNEILEILGKIEVEYKEDIEDNEEYISDIEEEYYYYDTEDSEECCEDSEDSEECYEYSEDSEECCEDSEDSEECCEDSEEYSECSEEECSDSEE